MAVAVETRTNGRPVGTVPPVAYDHEELAVRRGPRSGLDTVAAIHSTALGPALGGVRLWHYPSTEDGVRDALRLAAGMTSKAAAAGLDLGGGKGVICAPAGGLRGELRRAALLDFGDLVDSLGGRYITAEDVGISPGDLVAIGERTDYLTGMPTERGGTGDPSPFTAIGVDAAIRACLGARFGDPTAAGRTVAVIGLGHVGAALARRLAATGCELIVSDIDPDKRRLATDLGAVWVDADEAMVVECDVLAPCALGGAIDAGNAVELRCEIICGSANNQLADDSLAESLANARRPLCARFHRQRRRPDPRLPRDQGLLRGPRGAPGARDRADGGAVARGRRSARRHPAGRGARTRPGAARRRSARLNAMSEIWVVRAGSVPYAEARAIQRELEQARAAGEIADVLLLLEHPPVYTKTRRSTAADLPMGEDWYRAQGIEVADTDRGGLVTYHGPGQLVAYPIMSLFELGDRDDVHAYIRRMEDAIIAALGDWGVEARVFAGLTGVWVGAEPPPAGDARKIGSIGIHISAGVTTHGLAINVNNDLQPFEWITPCGIEAVRMTSLGRELGGQQDLDAFASSVATRLAESYRRRPLERSLDEVAGPLALKA